MSKFSESLLDSGTTDISNLLLNYYSQIGITNDELLIYLLIKQSHGSIIPMPDMEKLSMQSKLNENQIFTIFHNLIAKKMIKIVKKPIGNNFEDAYDFSGMYEKLAIFVEQNQDNEDTVDIKEVKSNSNLNRQTVFNQIEQEFGHTLSPIELETISQWIDLDNYDLKIIELALKEAVLNQVYSLKYMDRILVNWEKKNLKSVQQIEEYSRKRNDHSLNNSTNNSNYNGPDIPLINLTE